MSKKRLNQASIGTNVALESTCMSRFEDLGVLLEHLRHVLMASAKPVDQRCGRTTPASQKHEKEQLRPEQHGTLQEGSEVRFKT